MYFKVQMILLIIRFLYQNVVPILDESVRLQIKTGGKEFGERAHVLAIIRDAHI